MESEEREKTKKFKKLHQFLEDHTPAFVAAVLDTVLFDHACDLVDPHDRVLPDPSQAKSELYVLHELRDAINAVNDK